MSAKDPETRKMFYFIDKCLPFGSSISSVHFQCFSNALKQIMLHRGRNNLTQDEIDFIANYLDDFLFIAVSANRCNKLVKIFLDICEELGVPVAEDKTEWGTV